MEQNIFNKKRDILWNLSKASLEDITLLLDHYKASQVFDCGTVNMEPIEIEGVTYHGKYNPQEAASLNARYHELTGKDHPVFLEEQAKALDLLLSHKEELAYYGYLPMQIDTLELLKENLTQKEPAIDFLYPNHPFIRTSEIMLDLSKASLEEVSQILDHYKSSQVLDCGMVNLKPVIVEGVTHHYKYNPQEAASLNARYHELTGIDHPVFLEEQAKALDLLLSHKEELVKEGYLSTHIDTLEKLRANLVSDTPKVEVVGGKEKHILNRFDEVLMHVDEASFKDVNSLLNYYNGEPVVIDGLMYHPFNDPVSAAKLNARYQELTGQDHPTFVKQAPIVIDGLMRDKDALLQAKAYSSQYFDSLEEIKDHLKGGYSEGHKQR